MSSHDLDDVVAELLRNEEPEALAAAPLDHRRRAARDRADRRQRVEVELGQPAQQRPRPRPRTPRAPRSCRRRASPDPRAGRARRARRLPATSSARPGPSGRIRAEPAADDRREPRACRAARRRRTPGPSACRSGETRATLAPRAARGRRAGSRPQPLSFGVVERRSVTVASCSTPSTRIAIVWPSSARSGCDPREADHLPDLARSRARS